MDTEINTEKIEESQLKPMKLNIYVDEKLIVPINIYPNDNLLDLRQFLSEASQLFFITNYHFETNGEIINESVEIALQENIVDGSKVNVKIDPYDEKSARFHVKKIQDFSTRPYSYLNVFGKSLSALREDKPNANQEEEKKSNENIATKENQNNIKTTFEKSKQAKLTDYFTVSSSQPKKDKINLMDSLIFSNFNPAPSYRKLKGDYFYLSLRTLEGNDYQITSTAFGFYVNSSGQRNFNPKPQSSKVYINLLDLICSLSPQCKANLDKISILAADDDYLEYRPLSLYTSETKWLSDIDPTVQFSHESNAIRAESSLQNLHGFDPNGIRDWNEELQMCRELPKESIVQKINRDKAIVKTHNDFVEAATQGAKAIVDKMIQPLNQQDPENQQVFVYNHIFFSFVTHTPDSFRQESGLEASPTTSMSNNDLRNLRILHRLEMPELHFLNTAIVDYKGRRVLAQTIIPGILNSDHNECTEFGSIDDGQVIHRNEEFVEAMKKVCEYFSIVDEVELIDGEGKVVNIPASSEIKGIRSSDKKKYILDLMRLSPRDLNWPNIGDSPDNLCCVVRPELISYFINSKAFQNASQSAKEELEQKVAEEKKKAEGTEGEKSEISYTDYLSKIQENLLKDTSKQTIKFNPNLHTRVRQVQSEKLESQEKTLKELSEFLINQALPNLLNELVNGDIILPCDSKSLGELFHAHGVNVRYLGKLHKLFKKDEFPYLSILLERAMFARSFKHLLKEILKATHSMYHADVISHVLNAIFATPEVIEKIENNQKESVIRKSDKTSADESSEQDSKGGKKNKKKKTNKTNSTEQDGSKGESNPLLMSFGEIESGVSQIDLSTLKPSFLWDRIREICEKRYDHKLSTKVYDFEPFTYPLTKKATLRDACIQSGVVVRQLDYDLSKSKEIPFMPEDIIDLVPVVKHLDPISDECKQQIETANKLISEDKIEEAVVCLLGIIQILLNVYGPIHKDIAFCYSKVANIYFKVGDNQQAITYHMQSVKILETLVGIDNPQTAHAYSSLALIYFSAKKIEESFDYMYKSLYSFNLIAGEFHPDISMIYTNLASMHQESNQVQQAVDVLKEGLEKNIQIFGRQNQKTGYSYQALAMGYYDLQDLKKALENQEKCVSILKATLNENDRNLKESIVILDKIKVLIQENNSKSISSDPKSKPFGKNKKNKNSQQLQKESQSQSSTQLSAEEREAELEKERLLQRLKAAKMNVKHGPKRVGNLII